MTDIRGIYGLAGWALGSVGLLMLGFATGTIWPAPSCAPAPVEMPKHHVGGRA